MFALLLQREVQCQEQQRGEERGLKAADRPSQEWAADGQQSAGQPAGKAAPA